MSFTCFIERCGICNIILDWRETVVLGEDRAPSCCDCVASLTAFKVRGELISNEMTGLKPMIDQTGTEYIVCLGDCRHRSRATACHVDCAKQVAPWPLPEATRMLAYQYEPTPLEVEDRKRRLHDISFRFLSQILRQLPPEITSDIAMMCLRTIAVECSKGVRTLRGGKTTISVSCEIWAHGVTFEGRRYITSLSNGPDNYHDVPVFAPNPASHVRAVHLREDYVGVREVVFRHQCLEKSDSSVAPRQDSWWRIADLKSSSLAVESHVCRLPVEPISPQLTQNRASGCVACLSRTVRKAPAVCKESCSAPLHYPRFA